MTDRDELAQQADTMLLYTMIRALLNTHPSPGAVMSDVAARIESLAANAPPGTNPEFLVELRARLAVFRQSEG